MIDMLNSILAEATALGLTDLDLLLGTAIVAVSDEFDRLSAAGGDAASRLPETAPQPDPKVVVLTPRPGGRPGRPI